MIPEERLNQVADRYRTQGYQVVVRPGPDDLPHFAKDFKVEILAARDAGGVLASVKKSQSDLGADREIPRYAEVTNNQRGWRFDLFVLGTENEPTPDRRDVEEPSEDTILRALDEVERIRLAGFAQQALIAAWAALEAAMRKRLLAEGAKAGWGSSPRTMLNELYSDGVLQSRDFRELEEIYQVRNTIVHGFSSPVAGDGPVRFLVETARRLLDESRAAEITA